MDESIQILAVDDRPENVLILESALKCEEFNLTFKVNALEALKSFKSDYCDVILISLSLQGIDGFELRKLIRELDKERPIIFMQEAVDTGDVKVLQQVSWDAFTYCLECSISKEHLCDKIKEVVGVQRRRLFAKKYSRKLEEELELAGDLQQLLLPPWTGINSSAIYSFCYKPSLKVSGDILEFIHLGEERYLLFVGDIAGHGIGAALYMSTVLAFLKLKVNEEEFSIHSLLNELNTFFCNELGSGTSMTALVAIIDFATNSIKLQSAGHPPLTIVGKDTLRYSDRTKGALPIGWMESTVYSCEDNEEMFFDDDETILAFTDGVFDMENGEQNSISELDLMTLVATLSRQSELISLPFKLRESLERMGYDIAPDDFSCIALRKRIKNTTLIERVIAGRLNVVNRTATEFSALSDDAKTIALIELAVHEYLNNVIVHGKSPLIAISIEKGIDSYTIKGYERGKPWQPLSAEVVDDENKATSGRGLQILNNICESISYNSFKDLNETTMIIRGQK